MIVLVGSLPLKVIVLSVAFFVSASLTNLISRYEGMRDAYKSVLDDEFLDCGDHPSFQAINGKSELLQQIIDELKKVCDKQNGGA